MAKVKVSKILLEDLVFGFSKHVIEIKNGWYDPHTEMFIFDIEGEDVPKTCNKIEVIVSETRNRAGQRFIEMRFEEKKQKEKV